MPLGLRASEAVSLKVADIDSGRMVIEVSGFAQFGFNETARRAKINAHRRTISQNPPDSRAQSWNVDSFPRDRTIGHYFDPTKMRRTDLAGQHIRVDGVLTMPRCPQGRPLLIQAGSSGDGMAFAATIADVVYTAQTQLAEAQQFCADIKAQAAANGRDPSQLLVMPGLLPIIGATRDEAHARYREMKTLVDPLSAMEVMNRFYGDLSRYGLEGPVPPPKEGGAMVSRGQVTDRTARGGGWTIRRLLEETALAHSHNIVVGTAADIVDLMEDWVDAGAADGFNILPALSPADVDRFVDYVIPELQRRGRFRDRYPSGSLRDTLGLRPI